MNYHKNLITIEDFIKPVKKEQVNQVTYKVQIDNKDLINVLLKMMKGEDRYTAVGFEYYRKDDILFKNKFKECNMNLSDEINEFSDVHFMNDRTYITERIKEKEFKLQELIEKYKNHYEGLLNLEKLEVNALQILENIILDLANI
jgi:hypothetical protein